jgi:hypothetical protein
LTVSEATLGGPEVLSGPWQGWEATCDVGE